MTPHFVALDPAAYRSEALEQWAQQGARYHFEELSALGIPNFSLSSDGTLGAIEAGAVYPVVGVVYTLADLQAQRDPRRYGVETVPSGA